MPGNPSASTVAALAQATGDLAIAVDGDRMVPVTGLAYDSRRVGPGDLFFCIPGTIADGHDYATQAVRAGAAALCVERRLGAGRPEIVVADSRRAMARIARAFYGAPADGFLLLGVTGTNGKTTTAFLLES